MKRVIEMTLKMECPEEAWQKEIMPDYKSEKDALDELAKRMCEEINSDPETPCYCTSIKTYTE